MQIVIASRPLSAEATGGEPEELNSYTFTLQYSHFNRILVRELLFIIAKWQLHKKRTALTQFRFAPDAAFMQLDDFFGNR